MTPNPQLEPAPPMREAAARVVD
ncbi:MAG: hypothetical protein JWP79_1591, partial [Polaromonas sp.]|nr:hypothetical protein [Polaromonas sp.]